MTFLHNSSDENDGEDGENSPIPLIENNDNDDPPATGGCVVLEVDEENEQLTISKAPIAEPKHRAEPEIAVTV